MAAVYAVGLAQVATICVVVGLALFNLMTGHRDMGIDPVPDWLLVMDFVLSTGLIVGAYVMYRRGDLDEFTVRRR